MFHFVRNFHYELPGFVEYTPSRRLLIGQVAFFFFRQSSSPQQGTVVALAENPKSGNPVFSAHCTNTSPVLTSRPPDFAAPIACVYPVATGKTAILPTTVPNSRLVRGLSASSQQCRACLIGRLPVFHLPLLQAGQRPVVDPVWRLPGRNSPRPGAGKRRPCSSRNLSLRKHQATRRDRRGSSGEP